MSIVGAFAVPHPPLIIPEVSPGEEHQIQHTVDAYDEVGRRIAELAPETIVISSPHSVMYYDYLHISPGSHASGSFARFGARGARYSCDYDVDLVEQICQLADRDGLPAGTEGERDPELDHATMIPLHFIQRHYTAFKVVRIGLSELSPADHYELGQLVQEAARKLGRRVVFVASGDLSHKLLESGPYGFASEGPKFDERIEKDFSSSDFLDLLEIDRGFAERAAECGLRSFHIMAGALDRTTVKPEVLSHEGPFGVGYCVACFSPVGEEGADESRAFRDQLEAHRTEDLLSRKLDEDPYVSRARASPKANVPDGKRSRQPKGLPAEMYDTRAGAFVSIKKFGELRGCIGTILPCRASLAEEICANAISAAAHDPRFPQVSADELDDLVYDVDVLSVPERIDSEKDLDPRRYGVIVSTADGRRGLLLPDLEGVDTISEQVGIAARKGGIDLGRDPYSLERFTVTRHA